MAKARNFKELESRMSADSRASVAARVAKTLEELRTAPEPLAPLSSRPIESDGEFDRLVEVLEALDLKADVTPSEIELREMLAKRIRDYDDANYPFAETPPDGLT
jgi:hypothetical protein